MFDVTDGDSDWLNECSWVPDQVRDDKIWNVGTTKF